MPPNLRCAAKVITFAVFVLLISVSARAEAVDIKKQWVFDLSETISFSLFIDRLYETECKFHLPSRNMTRVSEIERWILSQPTNDAGKENLGYIVRSLFTDNVIETTKSIADKMFILLLDTSQAESVDLGKMCPKLLEGYTAKSDDLMSELKDRTRQLLKKFPTGIVIEHH